MRPRGLRARGHPGRARRGRHAREAGLALGVAALATAITWLLVPTSALAHTDLSATRPGDGETLAGPVTRIELEFSGALDAAGTSIRVLDGDGDVVPVEVTHVSDELVAVESADDFDGGRFAVLWSVRSVNDGHEISGSFSFEVTAPVDALTDVGTETGPSAADDPTDDDTLAASGEDPEQPTTTSTPVPTTVATAAVDEDAPVVSDLTQETAGDDLSDLAGGVGRWVSLLGTLLAIGATAFAGFGLTGTRSEITRVVGWIRAAGVAVVAGTVLEVGAAAVSTAGAAVLVDPIGFLDALPTSLAYAGVLRIAGGIALLQSPALVTTSHRAADVARVGAAGGVPDTEPSSVRDDAQRLVVREEWLILAGLVAITVSYLIDGHSADLGVLGRTANLVHVVSGGVWLGGVIVLGDLIVRRRRDGAPTRLAETTVRFSRVATVAVVAVAIAGGLLAWSIVDEPADLTSGSWGRLLIGKVALVAIAVAVGAYNHFQVVPHLDEDPDRVSTLARTLTAEGIALVLVVAVTAALVVSAP